MTVTLVPIGTLTVIVDNQARLESAAGTRVVGTSFDCRFEGERVRAVELVSPATDWITLRPDGTGSVDARMVLRTDDGADLLVRYCGRISYRGDAGASVVIAPTFETTDERYRWLNSVQGIGKGERVGQRLVYEIYAAE